ncbi:MAG: ABC transporter ATP-binding protein [Dethiosulfatibacter sp.]|nr:ABC transporter ATP-binding protein [Dethiosulfatibacter sp.]
MDNVPLLQVENLKVQFRTDRGILTAVDEVSFSVNPGEVVGIVGESGCGKSVMSQSIIRLLEHTDPVIYSGRVLFEGIDIFKLSQRNLRALRGNEISIIFQDPLTSLNPVYTVGNQMAEVLILHKGMSKNQSMERAVELLKLTGIPDARLCITQFPHELSGGMQQRVMIAMALACEPKLLIADEPTTALDVTIQAQIIDLIKKLNEELGMAVLFITHDLGVVSETCDSVRVMYLGQIVEDTTTSDLFKNPLHPYTKGLIKSIPLLEGKRGEELYVIRGTVPSLLDIPKGCRFSTRCDWADSKCVENEPPIEETIIPNHMVKCWYYKEINGLDKGGSSLDE